MIIPKVQNGIRVTNFEFNLSALNLILSIICETAKEGAGNVTDAVVLQKIFKIDEIGKELYVPFNASSNIKSFLQDFLDGFSRNLETLIQLNKNMDVLFLFHDYETGIGSMVSLIKKPEATEDTKKIQRSVNSLFRKLEYAPRIRPYFKEEIYAKQFDALCSHFIEEFNKDIVKFLDETTIPYYPFRYNALKSNPDDTYIKIDYDSFLFNEEYMTYVDGGSGIVQESIFEIICEGQRCGFRINDVVYPIRNRQWTFNDDEQLPISYDRLCNVFAKHEIRKIGDKAFEEFKSYAFEPDFCQLISQIKCNYYLPFNCAIAEKYKKLFDTVRLYKEIEDFDGVQIFTDTGEGEHNLGLYTNPKKGTHYHLRHWYKQNADGKVMHFTSEEDPLEIKTNEIYALKPTYSYYFMHKYFEDVLNRILTDLDYEFYENCKYISPQQGKETLCEADFIVKRPDKIIIIEAKTCLSKETLTDAINRKVKVMSEMFMGMFPNIKFEYLLVAQLSESALGPVDYFLDSQARKSLAEYNGMLSYDFDVRINIDRGVSLKCISHPDLNMLKELIRKAIE